MRRTSCRYHPRNYLWRKKLAERRAVWCWNLFENKEEGSNAMWQLYGHKGVAIESTIGDLKKAMANSGILRRLIARVWYGTPKASYLSAADAIFNPENKTSWPPWLMRPVPFQTAAIPIRRRIRFVFGIEPILASLFGGGIEIPVDGKALVQKVLKYHRSSLLINAPADRRNV